LERNEKRTGKNHNGLWIITRKTTNHKAYKFVTIGTRHLEKSVIYCQKKTRQGKEAVL